MDRAKKILTLSALGLLLGIGLHSCSCTRQNITTLGATEMWRRAQEIEPDIELVFLGDSDANQNRRVVCNHYPYQGCVPGSGKRIKVRLVELLVIQYETRREACRAAQAVGQWYAYNWLFDDVADEPVLEDFVRQAFDAVKPGPGDRCR